MRYAIIIKLTLCSLPYAPCYYINGGGKRFTYVKRKQIREKEKNGSHFHRRAKMNKSEFFIDFNWL